MDVKQVLEQAKLLVAQGWHQGGYTDGCGNLCLKGAIGVASGDMRPANGGLIYCGGLPERRLSTQACAAIMDALPKPFDSIPVFNDDPQTDLREILLVLDKAIAGVSGGR